MFSSFIPYGLMTITVGLIDSAAVSLNDPVLFEDPDLHNDYLLNGPDTSLFNDPPFLMTCFIY